MIRVSQHSTAFEPAFPRGWPCADLDDTPRLFKQDPSASKDSGGEIRITGVREKPSTLVGKLSCQYSRALGPAAKDRTPRANLPGRPMVGRRCTDRTRASCCSTSHVAVCGTREASSALRLGAVQGIGARSSRLRMTLMGVGTSIGTVS